MVKISWSDIVHDQYSNYNICIPCFLSACAYWNKIMTMVLIKSSVPPENLITCAHVDYSWNAVDADLCSVCDHIAILLYLPK